MDLVFWQGIISIHQKTFLEALTNNKRVGKVVLVVERDISPYRENMGWEVPTIEGVTIIMAPNRDEIKHILTTHKTAIHVMSGIRGSRMMAIAMRMGAREKVKMGAMSEPYDRRGLKGRLRDIKYWYFGRLFYKYFNFLLAIGKEGVNVYSRLGFSKKKLFPWAYFVSIPLPEKVPPPNSMLRIIYAGRIESGKGILQFVAELLKTGKRNYVMDIYGSGPDEEKLKQLIADHEISAHIQIHPFLKYQEMLLQYARYDWVVLPSTRKDGWGVIISEGLLNGLKGICSNICGVSWAIADGKNGVTFDWSKDGDCGRAIEAMLDESKFAEVQSIKSWADKALSGAAGAEYFLRIMDNVYKGTERPVAPWLANSVNV